MSVSAWGWRRVRPRVMSLAGAPGGLTIRHCPGRWGLRAPRAPQPPDCSCGSGRRPGWAPGPGGEGTHPSWVVAEPGWALQASRCCSAPSRGPGCVPAAQPLSLSEPPHPGLCGSVCRVEVGTGRPWSSLRPTLTRGGEEGCCVYCPRAPGIHGTRFGKGCPNTRFSAKQREMASPMGGLGPLGTRIGDTGWRVPRDACLSGEPRATRWCEGVPSIGGTQAQEHSSLLV